MQSLLRWYRDEGYLRAHIFPPKLSFNQDSSRVDLTLLINEGPLVRIGQVEIQGNGWLRRETIEELMDLRSGQVSYCSGMALPKSTTGRPLCPMFFATRRHRFRKLR